MEDKKMLNNEELEKVNGGFGNHEFEFGKDNFAMEDKKLLKDELLEKVSGGTALSDTPQRDEKQGWPSNNGAPSGGGIYTEE